jgi:large conductance mechanosensitive channel
MANKVKSFFSDFKTFITKGNILDMAVGVIVGGAFKDIVNALTNNVLMPLITAAVPGGLEGFVTVLNPSEAAVKAVADGTYVNAAGEAVTNVVEYWGVMYNKDVVNVMNWGSVINAAIDFLVIAFIMFVIVRAAMRFQQYSDHTKAVANALTLKEKKELRKQGKSWKEIDEISEKKLQDAADAKAKADAEAKAEADKKAAEPVELLREIKDLLEKQAK